MTVLAATALTIAGGMAPGAALAASPPDSSLASVYETGAREAPQQPAAKAMQARAAGWTFVRKLTGATCFELLRKGSIYGVVNVCSNNKGNARQLDLVYFGGAYHMVCMPQHHVLTLGVQGEFSVASARDSWPNGCNASLGIHITHTYVL